MPHRRLLATLLLSAAVIASATAASADPIDDARVQRDQAQAAAVGAAQQYSDALSEQARQEAEIARLEQEIPALRAQSAELRRQVRGRAVTLYEDGSSTALSRVVEAENAEAAARALELTSRAAGHDREAAAELTRTATQLEHDEAALKQTKAAQDALVAHLAVERAALELALADANNAVNTLQAVALSQAGFAGVDEAAAGHVRTGATICPVTGAVAFTNDWGAPRSGGRTHKGNDIFGVYGIPDVAVMAGTTEWNFDDLGGQGIFLHAGDGNVYYYAHLSNFAGPPRRVARGEVIGYLGDTGNAKGGPPHTHFEIRPGGGPAVNPYPTLRAICHQ